MQSIDIIKEQINEHKKTIDLLINDKELLDQIEKSAEVIQKSLSKNGKVILFGNGGSAADAQHIAAEFTGRFEKERQGLPAIALTTDTSALTAIGNDYGFDRIFSRQLEALANNGDICIGISTSGNSKNVQSALIKAKEIGCKTIGLLGRDGGAIRNLVDSAMIVPSNNTARIQEIHILAYHIICHLIDRNY